MIRLPAKKKRNQLHFLIVSYISIVLGHFRSHIAGALTHSFKALPGLNSVIGSMSSALANLSKRYIGVCYSSYLISLMCLFRSFIDCFWQPDYSKVSTAAVQPGQLDELAAKSYPMCMRAMHRKLRTSHHLKHTARMQYGLFLKGIGLSLENALLFWKSEFSKNVGPDVFEKTYDIAPCIMNE